MRVTLIGLGLVVFLAHSGPAALGADPTMQTSCELTQIDGTFTSGSATYLASGSCRIGSTTIRWVAQALYENHKLKEDITVFRGNGERLGFLQYVNYDPCQDDPWIARITCGTALKLGTSAPNQDVGLWIEFAFSPRVNQYKRPFSATFNHDRTPLLAKADADLKAEARRLHNSMQKIPLITPLILAPTANALFLSKTSVPIKIAPPQGVVATSFLVRLERRTPQGAWTVVTNLPVSAAEASSSSGYLGWGAGGPDGRSLPLMASPGTYRLSAQVSSPRKTGWSQGVEFVVTAPTKAIQRAPKAFGNNP